MLFTEEAIGFLFENYANNSKDWFKEHKPDYHRLIELPFAELITTLTPVMNSIDEKIICNPKKISRLYKDARYNKGGPIFRDSVWCSLRRERDKSEYHPLPEFYFYISTRGFGYGCGYYCTERDSMDEIRRLILSDSKEFKKAQKALDDNPKFILYGDEYKRNHYPNESEEKCRWLNRKTIGVSYDCDYPALLYSDDLTDRVAQDMFAIKDFYFLLMTAEDNLTAQKHH